MNSSPSTALRKTTGRRWWRGPAFRLAAVMLGLAPFVLAEAVLTVFDWGRPTYEEDPFVGFSKLQPLFELDAEGARYRIRPSRQGFFRGDSFAAKKGRDEFRIFCLGGSTVQGRPFAIEPSFTTWLQISLRAADSHRGWEVVNCGGVSYARYPLVPILEEVLGYEPDLIVLYTGHNEFLEDRTYGHIKHLPPVVARLGELLMRTRTCTLARNAYLALRGRFGFEENDAAAVKGRPILGPETVAELEYRDGMDKYHRDDKWRQDVIEHFRYNLRRMVQLSQDAGVPVLLVNPVCNLRDSAPFKTQHRDGLTPDELQQWESLVERARRSAFRTGNRQIADLSRAVELLKQAIAIDPRHAGVHYLLATCYDGLGRLPQARASYLRAKEEDVCPLRILEPMHEAIFEVARQTGTPLVDVRKLFEQLSEGGIPGNFRLLDHVHPSVAGHQLIAEALADELVRQGFVRGVSDWKQRAKRDFDEHHASLDSFYFNKGLQRLETLRLWTQGKAKGVRPSGQPSPRGP